MNDSVLVLITGHHSKALLEDIGLIGTTLRPLYYRKVYIF